MIRAGKFFCPHCAGIDTHAIYRHSEHKQVIVLTRTLFGGRLEAAAYNPVTESIDRDAVKLDPPLRMGDDGGIPDRISVRFKGEAKTVDARRYCRSCGNEMYPGFGKHPLYVIATVGDRGAGKTAWLDAIAYPGNFSLVNWEPYPFKLEFVTVSAEEGKSEATTEFGHGHTKLLQLSSRADNRIFADVLLLDIAGELYEKNNPLVWKLLRSHGTYTGADAFIFLESDNRSTGHAQEVYEKCAYNKVFKDKPVAWVKTHLDTILTSGSCPRVDDVHNRFKLPLLNMTTFKKTTSYHPKELLDRLAIENCIAASYRPQVLLDKPGLANQGFLVQSCTTFQGADGTLKERRSESCNVMDPLLWTLNQLGIFPLTEGGLHIS